MLKLPIRSFFKISAYNEATETCYTVMEREDYFENCEKLSYEALFAFIWQVAELAKKPIY